MPVYKVPCRFGKIFEVGEFFTDIPNIKRDTLLVVRTENGMQLATALKPPTLAEGIEQLPDSPKVLRIATVDDKERQKELETVREKEAMAYCKEQIKNLNLTMRLLDVEYLFGGEKILFYYVAPERVDFRELVRILAHKYHTRIEMRQLGVRDAARLVLDFSHCGEELCCRRFLKEFKPVSVRTARLQKTTLDPSKISGACGRLMCCLLYEDFLYAELKKNIPEREEKVRTERGEAVVIGYNIIEQTVTVQYEGGERETLPASQIVRIAPLQPEKEEELRFD